MRLRLHHAPVFCILLLVIPAARAQQVKSATCGNLPAAMQSNLPNIFSEQQEQWLGEALVDYVEADYRPVKDAALNAYLNTIGTRLLAVLPPTRLKFRFTIVESSQVNGFSLAGGNVYLTRKLIASAHSEDEIAGVIAHEMGHILTHQSAIETTADLKLLLGITSVGDRADIFAKFQRLIDAQQHQKHRRDPDSGDNQDQADRVAIYAAASAGYRPQAYAEFWDRSFFVDGKVGSKVSDFFRTTSPDQKRLRKLRGIIAELPATCVPSSGTVDMAAFTAWQHKVLEDQAAGPKATTLSATQETTLTPPLRLDIRRLRYSRDGKLVLAQDDNSIFILTRDPFVELLRIDAEGALPADFTPDSTAVVFTTPGMHVERWSIADKKLMRASEVITKDACIQIFLAPDGRTIVCPYLSSETEVGLRLLDVANSEVLFEKKQFVFPNMAFLYSIRLSQYYGQVSNDFVTMSLSPDGDTLLLGPGTRRLAFDLKNRTAIKLSGTFTNNEFNGVYVFEDNDRVFLQQPSDPSLSGAFSFPDGKRLTKVKVSAGWVGSTTGHKLVLTRGPANTGLALADLESSKYVLTIKTAAMDTIDQEFVIENSDGSLVQGSITEGLSGKVKRARLSISSLSRTSAISVSQDARYIAVSQRSRGAVWDLETGAQTVLLRGFSHGWWTEKGDLLAQTWPRDKDHPSVIVDIHPNPKTLKDSTYKLPENAELIEGHLLEWKKDKRTWTFTASSPDDLSLQWKRDYTDVHPGYATNDGDRDLIFSSLLTEAYAKETMRSDPRLSAQADTIKQKAGGRLLERVSSADGTVRQRLVLQVPLTYEGVGGFNWVGDLLYLSVGDNRTIVYAGDTGKEVRQVFGSVVAVDQPTQMICTVNRRDEAIVTDRTGKELLHVSLRSPLRFARILEGGKELIVLTADQQVRRFAIGTVPVSVAATR